MQKAIFGLNLRTRFYIKFGIIQVMGDTPFLGFKKENGKNISFWEHFIYVKRWLDRQVVTIK